MARLIVFPGTPQARQLPLKVGVNSIGRAPLNDVTLDDGSVSGSHCQLIVSDGRVRIRDVGSTNGTMVNGTPVTETEVQPGHRIQLGGVELLFEADEMSSSGELPGTPTLPPPPPIPLTPRERWRSCVLPSQRAKKLLFLLQNHFPPRARHRSWRKHRLRHYANTIQGRRHIGFVRAATKRFVTSASRFAAAGPTALNTAATAPSRALRCKSASSCLEKGRSGVNCRAPSYTRFGERGC